MQLTGGFFIRKILDETIAVPTREAAHRLSGLVAMNETGEFLFQLLQSTQTKESLVEALLQNYDIDRQTAEKDVIAFLEILQENNLLENSSLNEVKKETLTLRKRDGDEKEVHCSNNRSGAL